MNFWPFSKEGDGPKAGITTTWRCGEPQKLQSRSRIAPKQYGPLAFENYQSEEAQGCHPASGLRLLSHAVQDDTMLKKYIPAVRAFLYFAQARGRTFMTCVDVDMTLALYLDHVCFNDELSFSTASCCFFGLLAVYPELHMKLPVAHRAWKSWERNHLSGEGTPVPQEAAYLLAEWLRESGFMLEALLVELALDCYLRSSDWEKLRAADVHDDGVSTALILGSAERGEKAKTGPNQGVVIDSAVLRRDLMTWVRSLKADQHVFPFSGAHFRSLWIQAKNALAVQWLGPPHDLRHGGASRDVEAKTRDLEGIRRRGRWKSMESVQRYTKAWVLVRERGRLTGTQRTRGAELAAARGQQSSLST